MQEFFSIELGEVKWIPRSQYKGMEIFFILKGEVVIEVDGAQYEMKQEDIILCNSFETRTVYSSKPNILLRLKVQEDYLHSELGIKRSRVICCNSILSSTDEEVKYRELKRLFTRLLLCQFERGENDCLEFKALLLQFLYFLVSNFKGDNRNQAMDLLMPQDDRMASIISFVEQNYASGITLQEIAQQEHLSLPYLSKLFKEKCGMNFTKYLSQFRLKQAVGELISSSQSILKIAMNNGFSSVSVFNRLFTEIYGETPSEFRLKRKVDSDSAQDEIIVTDIKIDKRYLLKYLKQFDVRFLNFSGEEKPHHFDVQVPGPDKIKRRKKIICIGRLSEILKADIQEELLYLKENCSYRHIHFSGVFNDGIYPYSYAYHEYNLAFDFLVKMNLTPIIRLDIEKALSGCDDRSSVDGPLSVLSGFCTHILQRYGYETVRNWEFEVSDMSDRGWEQLKTYFPLFSAIICSFISGAGTGINMSFKESDKDKMEGFFKWMKQESVNPAFVSVNMKRMRVKHLARWEEDDKLRNYYTYSLDQLKQAALEQGIGLPAVYLMDWDCLSENSTMQTDTFYQAAIIADTLMSLPEFVDSVAFWLNTHVYEMVSKRADVTIMAMFHFGYLKMTAYFVAKVWDMMYESVVCKADGFLLTKNERGDYTLLVCNPCYFNPDYSSDPAFAESPRRNISFYLNGLRGIYIFDRYTVDKEHASLYNRWAAVGSPEIISKNVIKYLEETLNMSYSAFEEDMSKKPEIHLDLGVNEMAVFIITRKIQYGKL